MNINIIAVGDKLPSWVNDAVSEYRKRIRGSFNLKITEVPTEKRGKGQPLNVTRDREGKRILTLIQPNDFVAALSVTGKAYTSETFAAEIQYVLGMGKALTFLIGGPDGLSKACCERANSHWSLSSFTLPHGMARVLIVEQLYRAQTILTRHPYHK